MTVTAMRAAVIAIRAGAFDEVSVRESAVDQAPGTVVVESTPPAVTGLPPWAAVGIEGTVLLVVAGHAGAGASTVALAVAEALAEDRRVQLVDYADPARSGLAAASAIELGTDAAGWRRGRRGRLDVVRRPAGDGGLSPLPEADDADRLLVVDAGGSPTTALLDSPGHLVRASLVVTRMTVPAVRQTEQVLAAFGGEPVVAAVGPARWPRAASAACGPRLRELRSGGRVRQVPVGRRLEVTGLTGDRLPKPVIAAGRSLAALLAPAGEQQPRRRHRAPGARGGAGASR